jgi:hypothetical protein
MMEFTTSGTREGVTHYYVNGQEVTEKQYQIAWELEQRIKELK